MKKLWAFSKNQLKSHVQYKADNLFVIFSTLIASVIQYYIWRYVEVTEYLNVKGVVIYTLCSLIYTQLLPVRSTIHFLSSKVLKGEVVYLLQRPFSLITISLFVQIGTIIYKVIYRTIPLILFYLLIFRIDIFGFHSLDQLLYFSLSCILGILLSFIIGYGISLISIVLIRIEGITNLFYGLLIIFGGGLLPLELYPAWIEKISFFTPFPAISYIPLSLLVSFDSQTSKEYLLIQLFWIALFLIFLLPLSKKVQNKISIMGG